MEKLTKDSPKFSLDAGDLSLQSTLCSNGHEGPMVSSDAQMLWKLPVSQIKKEECSDGEYGVNSESGGHVKAEPTSPPSLHIKNESTTPSSKDIKTEQIMSSTADIISEAALIQRAAVSADAEIQWQSPASQIKEDDDDEIGKMDVEPQTERTISSTAGSKIELIKATTISSHHGSNSHSTDGFYGAEIRDLKKRVAVMETARCIHTECSAALDGITQRLKQMEERFKAEELARAEERIKAEERFKRMEELIQQMVNARPQTPHHASPSVRRQLTFDSEVDPQTNPKAPVIAGPTQTTRASATPLPDIDLRVLSAEREKDFYKQCQQQGRHRPDIYAANVFMALTPFDQYQRWGKTVNWNGSNGKAMLPRNLKRKIHQLTSKRFPDLSTDQWAKIRGRINERLRSPRKVDPEAQRFGFH